MQKSDNISRRFREARALFPHAGKVAYFNAASYGPFATTVKDAIDDNMAIRLEAEKDDSHWAYGLADELRRDYAALIGAPKRTVGLGVSTSFGLNVAAFGLPLKKGDEVLVSDVEFPAIVYAFRGAAEARGIKLRMLRVENRCFDIEAFRKAIRPRTKVLALSFVQFFNGYKNDLQTIGQICREHGLYFVVDSTQGMGTEPINVRKLGIDVLSNGCQKWMLAPQGCGFFYLSDEIRDRITPPFMSWLGADWKMKFGDLFHYDKPYFDTARRFELGYYVVLNLAGMKAAVEIFQKLGIRNIQKHNHALIDRLADYLRSNPAYTITSSLEEKHRSSIFTFSGPDLKRLHRRILDRKIILVRREGSIRVSAHLYNDESDVDRLIEVLDKYARS